MCSSEIVELSSIEIFFWANDGTENAENSPKWKIFEWTKVIAKKMGSLYSFFLEK